MSSLLKPVRSLGHCSDRGLGKNDEEAALNAATIVLVHRHNFGLGEVGVSPPGRRDVFREEREKTLDSVHLCRLIEAQQFLLRWCLEPSSEGQALTRISNGGTVHVLSVWSSRISKTQREATAAAAALLRVLVPPGEGESGPALHF